ncbi:tetratricopeptide repeat protein [Terriglobus roseus]|uniref:Coatomer epsilon subunit n=1 Tax=Terriglobus roseus TaxID=392734 RepID=A0A1H4MJE9_9BACT|nr:coatomer subunit epsilon [Terriglobus roseus]SEB83211.1 Coatomer epsilon subunit [Terriglobus roseus]
MDTPTRTKPLAIREDGPLAVNTNSSSTAFFDRIQNNRALAIRLAVAVVALVVIASVFAFVSSHRAEAASSALAEAMQTYDAPIATPDQPVPANMKSFSSLEERAKAANAQFADVANKYGSTDAGRNALYLQGVTAMQAGQNASAEELLKKSSDSWNHDIATLSQMALAGLYRSTARESLAIEQYNKVIAKPSTLVPAGLAQLELAEMYEANGKQAEAKKIYAQIKDKDPKSASAEIATQKLSGPSAQ